MPAHVAGAVLLAALLHAGWNALVKSRADIFMTTVLVAVGGALLSALALPFLGSPARASWPFMAASVLVHLGYYSALVATYRRTDMSLGYPLMRGSAPLLVALASGPVIGEALAPGQWLAILCICGGILAMYLGAHRRTPGARRGVATALLTAALIAGYTLIDGAGARRSGAPVSYTMWHFVTTGCALVAWTAYARPGQFARYAAANPRVMLMGGAGSLGSYGIALWAMTLAPVASVAALRETSILFAALIAALVLREKIGPLRGFAIAVVACGAILMRLA